VTATVSPGGAVSLAGHTFLVPKAIAERFGNAAARVDELERGGTQFDLTKAKEALAKVNDNLNPPATGSWYYLCWACIYLDRAEEELRRIQQMMLTRPSPTGRVYPPG
jgi:hypothetical protein